MDWRCKVKGCLVDWLRDPGGYDGDREIRVFSKFRPDFQCVCFRSASLCLSLFSICCLRWGLGCFSSDLLSVIRGSWLARGDEADRSWWENFLGRNNGKQSWRKKMIAVSWISTRAGAIADKHAAPLEDSDNNNNCTSNQRSRCRRMKFQLWNCFFLLFWQRFELCGCASYMEGTDTLTSPCWEKWEGCPYATSAQSWELWQTSGHG